MPKRGPLIFLAALLAVLLPFLLQVVWPFLTSFLLASILAIVTYPAKEWLNRRFHRPGPAALLTTFATVVVVGLAFMMAVLTITSELTAAYDALSRRSLEEGGWPTLVIHTADRVVDALATRLPIDKEAIRTELIDRMKSVSGYLLANIGAAAGDGADDGSVRHRLSLFPAAIREGLAGPAGRSDAAGPLHHRQHSAHGD